MLVYDLPMKLRFRGISRRQGIIFRGHAGWAEWSPFLDYTGKELVPWWRAAQEIADQGFPPPKRSEVYVNATIPAVSPEDAYKRTLSSGCRTAKVKVAEPGQTLADDQARVAAVREALGAQGRLRIDANGAWSLAEAKRALQLLASYDLEYAEQPCRTTQELAELRRWLIRNGISVPIAADESIRRSEDPALIKRLAAADIAVLKVQPLGGIQSCLRWAVELGIPVVVSSALETSIGIAAGLALAAALPELPYDCGLNTVNLLAADLVKDPLIAVDGKMTVRNVEPDPSLVTNPNVEIRDWWGSRLQATKGLL